MLSHIGNYLFFLFLSPSLWSLSNLVFDRNKEESLKISPLNVLRGFAESSCIDFSLVI